MRISGRLLAGLTAWLLMMGIVPMGTAPGSQEDNSRVPAAPGDLGAFRLPLTGFTANVGQLASEEVRYYLRSGGVQMGFIESGVLLKLEEPKSVDVNNEEWLHPEHLRSRLRDPTRELLIRIGFEEANAVSPEGRGEVPHRSQYFLGGDPSNWRTDVRTFREVIYANLYEGIDLVYRLAEGSSRRSAFSLLAKYEFVVRPGADPARIRLTYDGAENVELKPSGEILVHTPVGELRDSPPIAYEQGGGSIGCAFAVFGHRSVGFQCEPWDASLPLVIDPLLYSTFLGGGDEDTAYGVGVDSDGFVYVTGYTYSVDFPVKPVPGAYDSSRDGPIDAFVSKLFPGSLGDPDLIYSTYLGGNGIDIGYGIAIRANGYVYVTGYTTSSAATFPLTTGCYDNSLGGTSDAFVIVLNPAGTGSFDLIYGTYLGGDSGPLSTEDGGNSISVDSTGVAYVTGFAHSHNFPVQPNPGAYQTSHGGGLVDAFISKLNPAGAGSADLVYSTYLGGNDQDSGLSIKIGGGGKAFVTGSTNSPTGFPIIAGVFDPSWNGAFDAFFSRLNPAGGGGSDLEYFTYFGGTNNDDGYGLVLDLSGNVVFTGGTASTQAQGFPLKNAYDDMYNGGASDVFVAKLNPAGTGSSDLLYSTYLGGDRTDVGRSITLDPGEGGVDLTGTTDSTNFPTTPHADYPSPIGGNDAFVTWLSAGGNLLLFSTYLGGSSNDGGYAIAFYSISGKAVVAGTTSPGIPTPFPTTPGAYDTTSVSTDCFVTILVRSETP